MEHSNLFQIASDTPWENLGNGIERQVYGYDDRIMMVRAKFDANAEGYMHEHPHSQVTYVESGVFDMTIGEVTKTITQGDGYYVPPNIRHGCICKEAGILIDVFSPHREDILQSSQTQKK